MCGTAPWLAPCACTAMARRRGVGCLKGKGFQSLTERHGRQANPSPTDKSAHPGHCDCHRDYASAPGRPFDTRYLHHGKLGKSDMRIWGSRRIRAANTFIHSTRSSWSARCNRPRTADSAKASLVVFAVGSLCDKYVKYCIGQSRPGSQVAPPSNSRPRIPFSNAADESMRAVIHTRIRC